MLLENDYLYEDKSGIENLKIFGLYFGYKLVNYETYAEILNLKEHLEKRVSTYSKGMKRKLSLLIVILMDRGIIYLDEVTSGVDPISRVEIRKIINELKLSGKLRSLNRMMEWLLRSQITLNPRVSTLFACSQG